MSRKTIALEYREFLYIHFYSAEANDFIERQYNITSYGIELGDLARAVTHFKNGGRRFTFIEPLVVVRECTNSWGKRKIDLKELYALRFIKGLLWRELIVMLGVSRITLIDNLKKAEALYGRFDHKAHENIHAVCDRASDHSPHNVED